MQPNSYGDENQEPNYQFVKMKFREYDDIENADKQYGISDADFYYFGDRSPEGGYEKIRLLSKVQHQVYWLFKVPENKDLPED